MKDDNKPLTGTALIKETCRRIRVARSYWDAHKNRACRGEREKALALYESISEAECEKVPQVLRVWLRYRSEKYFGDAKKQARFGDPTDTRKPRPALNRTGLGLQKRQRCRFKELRLRQPELCPATR